MLKFHHPIVLKLRDGELVRCDQACRLRVEYGRVWITRMHDTDDHFLDAGQTLALRAGARSIIGAEGAAQVELAPAPARPHALLRWFMRRSAAPQSSAVAA